MTAKEASWDSVFLITLVDPGTEIMKSLLAPVAILLLAVGLFVTAASFSPQRPARAQDTEAEPFVPLDQAIDRYLAETDERRPREPEQMHDRHREHPQAEHRNFEREVDEQQHRIQNLHVAAEHLEQAGMHDLAHRIHREAEESKQRLREHLDRHRHPEHHAPHPPGPEVMEMLQQLRNEVHELRREVNELREAVQQRSDRREK